jgi:hypothetical protein
MKSVAERRGEALRQLETLGRVSVPSAALILNLHEYTIREYIARGFLDAFMIGRRAWITAQEISRFQVHGKRDPEAVTSVVE